MRLDNSGVAFAYSTARQGESPLFPKKHGGFNVFKGSQLALNKRGLVCSLVVGKSQVIGSKFDGIVVPCRCR